MPNHPRTKIPETWTPEEEQAYREFLEACKTFPKEGLLTREELDQAHRRIFGEPMPQPLRRAKRFWAIAAAAVAIAASMVTVSAFQNQLRRFFLRETPIATDVAVIPPDDGENSETISYYWDAAYVPEGYVLDYTDISDLDTLLVYKNGDNEYFQISTMSLNGTPSIDTEDFIKQEIEIGDGSGYLYTTLDDSNIRLLLLYEDCVLFIEGKVSQKEVLKIAETLYKVSLA